MTEEILFDKLFARYGGDDYVEWGFSIVQKTWGYYRVRQLYNPRYDWLFDAEPVNYWGA